MERTATVEYAIQHEQDGVWRRWFAHPDHSVAEREWGHIQAIQPRVPVRFMTVEVVRSSEDEA